MKGKRHSTCKLLPFRLKRAKDRRKEYLLNVYSVINGDVCGFLPLPPSFGKPIEFSNQGSCEVLEIEFQTLLNTCFTRLL